MSDANEALAEVRGWLCDNLSSGDAGKVCGMLSSVSRRINELEAENAELKKAMDFQALELGCMTDNRDVLHVENTKLREMVEAVIQCAGVAKRDKGCDACPMYDKSKAISIKSEWCRLRPTLREMGIEVDV